MPADLPRHGRTVTNCSCGSPHRCEAGAEAVIWIHRSRPCSWPLAQLDQCPAQLHAIFAVHLQQPCRRPSDIGPPGNHRSFHPEVIHPHVIPRVKEPHQHFGIGGETREIRPLTSASTQRVVTISPSISFTTSSFCTRSEYVVNGIFRRCAQSLRPRAAKLRTNWRR